MLNELEFKAFLQEVLNRTPDDDQMDVLREIARVAESNEAMNYFRVGASAGSGKTTLILFAYTLLRKFCGIPSNQIAILTLNTSISKKINLSIGEIESRLKKPELSDVCAYTFHAFAMRFLRKASMKKGDILTENASVYHKDVSYKFQNFIGEKYLDDEKFRKDIDSLDFLAHSEADGSTEKSKKVMLSERLSDLGISSNGAVLRGDIKRRCSKEFQKDRTLRGDSLLAADGNPLPQAFQKRICDIANRLFLWDINYDLKICDDRAIILIIDNSDFGKSQSAESARRKSYIEIVDGDQDDHMFYGSLLVNGKFLKSLPTQPTPEDWLKFSPEETPSDIEGLREFCNECNANTEGQKNKDLSGLTYIGKDELSKFLMEIIERLRAEGKISIVPKSGSMDVKTYVDKILKKYSSSNGNVESVSNLIGESVKTRAQIESFFNILSTTLCELIDVNFETFSAVMEKAVGKSPLSSRCEKMLSNLRFVFVDEAQDMNRVFVDVLKEIRKCAPAANFITVGDPAQAINRFIGAHPTLFLNLANPSKPVYIPKDGADTGDNTNHTSQGQENPFGNFKVKRFELPITYRMDLKLVNAANTFKNFKLVKNDNSNSPDKRLFELAMRPCVGKTSKGNIEVHCIAPEVLSEFSKKFYDTLCGIIEKELAKNKDADFALLARTNLVDSIGDLELIRQKTLLLLKSKGVKLSPMKLRASTVHRYKGEEADCVVILDATSENYPKYFDETAQKIKQILFKDSLNADYDDSVNLFYVAITRARHSLHFICNGNPSAFLTRAGILPPQARLKEREVSQDVR